MLLCNPVHYRILLTFHWFQKFPSLFHWSDLLSLPVTICTSTPLSEYNKYSPAASINRGVFLYATWGTPIYGGRKCPKRGILAEVSSRFDLVLVSFFTRHSPLHENTPIYGQAMFPIEVTVPSFRGRKRVGMTGVFLFILIKCAVENFMITDKNESLNRWFYDKKNSTETTAILN